ncbi:restriction endonuclease subunit S [Thioalkalivibrio sp.]|uniref:restriction endonuclease subunit S n=1 Tax=Thioalkalivibrio sp. TaxID=2093813 RepID=UPI0039761892
MSETTTLRPGYEKPEDRSFPQDWKVSRLYEACIFHQGGKLGITKSAGYVASGVPAYSAAGQDGYVGQVEFSNTDGVVLSAIGANCGRCFFASGNWTTLANVQAIIPSPSQLDAKYLYYRVNRESYWPRSGSAQPFIKPSDVRNCWVAHPPIDQQKLIARILDTLDTQIQKTEALIAKLEKVKEGLLHDLLTRGIDENGQLRPSPEQAPELYKDSPLGLIPRGAEAVTLAELVTWSSGGTPSRAVKTNWLGTVPLLTPKDMKCFELHDTSEHVSETAAATESKVMVANTVFVVVRGMILAHSFPVILARREMAFNQDIKGAATGTRLDEVFFAHWLSANKHHFLKKVTESTHGTKKLDMEALNAGLMLLPQLDEQSAIVSHIQAFDQRIAGERDILSKLTTKKAGLMDDLLTGRVRVTPLLDQAQAQGTTPA